MSEKNARVTVACVHRVTLKRCVNSIGGVTPSFRALPPGFLFPPGRIITAYAIYTPFEGNSSTQSWSEVLRYLKERGMNPPRLVIADGDLGIVAQRLPRSRRTEMLESSYRQLAGQDPQGSTQSGLVDVAADPVCRNTAGSRASQRTIPTLVWQERTGGSG